MMQILGELRDSHTNIVPTYLYEYYEKNTHDSPGKKDAYCIDLLELSKDDYTYWQDATVAFNEKYEKYFNGVGGAESYFTHRTYYDSNTLYLKIKKFMMSEEECDSLRSLVLGGSDYDSIVIDICGNSGGNSNQWLENIVRPLLKGTVETQKLLAFRGGPLADTYLAFIENSEDYSGSTYPIAAITQGLDYPSELASDFECFHSVVSKYLPKDSISFEGDIYLLVDNRVYSSAEGFATFCKQTSFATIIGEQTKGDGGSFEPALFRLPNSGLLVRMRLQLTLNPDVSSRKGLRSNQ